MTPPQIIAVATLWIMVATLLALVLLMYAQIERAYRRSSERDDTGLEPGSTCPDLDLMTFEGLVPFEFPSEDRLHALVFIQRGCDACTNLLSDFAAMEQAVVPVSVLQGDGGQDPTAKTLPRNVIWKGLGDPDRAYRDYKINSFPMVFVCQGRTVVSVGHASSAKEIEQTVHHIATHPAAEQAVTPH